MEPDWLKLVLDSTFSLSGGLSDKMSFIFLGMQFLGAIIDFSSSCKGNWKLDLAKTSRRS